MTHTLSHMMRRLAEKFSELVDRLLVKLGKYIYIGKYRLLVTEHNPHKHVFCGIGFVHAYDAIYLFEQIFREFRPARVVELGTGAGGLSSYLKMICVNYGAEFYTYDVRDYREQSPETELQKLIRLSENHFVANIFEEKTIKNISETIKKDGCCFIYCDDGNKVREFKTYVKFLKSGDIISMNYTLNFKEIVLRARAKNNFPSRDGHK